MLTLRSQKSKDDDAYSNVIFKSTLNVCKLSTGVIANFVVKVVAMAIQDHANFTVKCPFKKVSNKKKTFRVDSKIDHPLLSGLLRSPRFCASRRVCAAAISRRKTSAECEANGEIEISKVFRPCLYNKHLYPFRVDSYFFGRC